MKKRGAFLLVLSAAAVAGSAAVFVDLNSINPVAPYGTWETAATTIQAAVDVAVNGDTIWVNDGHYLLSSKILIQKTVTIQSVNGPQVTRVDGDGAVRCFEFNSGNMSQLTGFTITNGYEGIGGGVYCADGNPVVSNCILINNAAFIAAGGMFNGTAVSCLFVGNTGALVGAMFGEDSVAINCTFVENAGGDGVGGMSNGTAKNCIFRNNSSSSGERNISLNYTIISNSCAPELTHGVSGNLTNAPLFIDPGGGDFRLDCDSPCIHAGDDGAVLGDADLDENPRILGASVDMGAYEFIVASDRDGDGLDDLWEWIHFGGNADPDGDEDGDGLKNRYESASGSDPNEADTDSDGMNDYGEWVAGTSLTDPASLFTLECQVQPNGSRHLIWQGVAGRYYCFEYSDRLIPADWQAYPFEILGSDTPIIFVDSYNGTRRYYRVNVRKP